MKRLWEFQEMSVGSGEGRGWADLERSSRTSSNVVYLGESGVCVGYGAGVRSGDDDDEDAMNGKINQSEPSHACAVREVRPSSLLVYYIRQPLTYFAVQVLEETGYNLADQIDPDDVIEVSIREQLISLYIVPGVPEGFEFQTRTRKEISVRRLP